MFFSKLGKLFLLTYLYHEYIILISNQEMQLGSINVSSLVHYIFINYTPHIHTNIYIMTRRSLHYT